MCVIFLAGFHLAASVSGSWHCACWLPVCFVNVISNTCMRIQNAEWNARWLIMLCNTCTGLGWNMMYYKDQLHWKCATWSLCKLYDVGLFGCPVSASSGDVKGKRTERSVYWIESNVKIYASSSWGGSSGWQPCLNHIRFIFLSWVESLSLLGLSSLPPHCPFLISGYTSSCSQLKWKDRVMKLRGCLKLSQSHAERNVVKLVHAAKEKEWNHS